MPSPEDQAAAGEPSAKVATVAASVLTAFIDELEATPALSDVASRLRKTILVDGLLGEPAINAAIFPEPL